MIRRRSVAAAAVGALSFLIAALTAQPAAAAFEPVSQFGTGIPAAQRPN